MISRNDRMTKHLIFLPVDSVMQWSITIGCQLRVRRGHTVGIIVWITVSVGWCLASSGHMNSGSRSSFCAWRSILERWFMNNYNLQVHVTMLQGKMFVFVINLYWQFLPNYFVQWLLFRWVQMFHVLIQVFREISAKVYQN